MARELPKWTPPLFGWQYELERGSAGNGVVYAKSIWETKEGDPYDVVIRGQRYKKSERWDVIFTFHAGTTRAWFNEEGRRIGEVIQKMERKVMKYLAASDRALKAINSGEEWD